MLACTALKCLWLVLEPAVLLCLSVLDVKPRRGPQLQAHPRKENAGHGQSCSWSRGKKTQPVPAWVPWGLASVAQILYTHQWKLCTTCHTETHAGHSVVILSLQGLCRGK